MANDRRAAPHRNRRARLVSVLGLGMLLAGGSAVVGQVTLKLERRQKLEKQAGQVDQALEVPGGGYLVRDADFERPKTQALELYDQAGRFLRKLGGAGDRPGSYLRLTGAATTRDGLLWAADLVGRLSFFNPQGALRSTRLVQNPGFQIDSLSVDEPHGVFYLAGCLPIQHYIDDGCRLVHQFGLADRRYRKSFLRTDPGVVAKGLAALSTLSVDVDPKGRPLAVDAPSFLLLRADPASGREEVFPLRSLSAAPMPPLGKGEKVQALFDRSAKVARVVAAGSFAVVVLTLPRKAGELLEVFDSSGRQIAIDLRPPGKLVGKTASGRLLFAARSGLGFELIEAGLVSATARPRR